MGDAEVLDPPSHGPLSGPTGPSPRGGHAGVGPPRGASRGGGADRGRGGRALMSGRSMMRGRGRGLAPIRGRGAPRHGGMPRGGLARAPLGTSSDSKLADHAGGGKDDDSSASEAEGRGRASTAGSVGSSDGKTSEGRPMSAGGPSGPAMMRGRGGPQMRGRGQPMRGGPHMRGRGQPMRGGPQMRGRGQPIRGGPQMRGRGQPMRGGPQMRGRGQPMRGGPQMRGRGQPMRGGPQMRGRGQPMRGGGRGQAMRGGRGGGPEPGFQPGRGAEMFRAPRGRGVPQGRGGMGPRGPAVRTAGRGGLAMGFAVQGAGRGADGAYAPTGGEHVGAAGASTASATTKPSDDDGKDAEVNKPTSSGPTGPTGLPVQKGPWGSPDPVRSRAASDNIVPLGVEEDEDEDEEAWEARRRRERREKTEREEKLRKAQELEKRKREAARREAQLRAASGEDGKDNNAAASSEGGTWEAFAHHARDAAGDDVDEEFEKELAATAASAATATSTTSAATGLSASGRLKGPATSALEDDIDDIEEEKLVEPMRWAQPVSAPPRDATGRWDSAEPTPIPYSTAPTSAPTRAVHAPSPTHHVPSTAAGVASPPQPRPSIDTSYDAGAAHDPPASTKEDDYTDSVPGAHRHGPDGGYEDDPSRHGEYPEEGTYDGEGYDGEGYDGPEAGYEAEPGYSGGGAAGDDDADGYPEASGSTDYGGKDDEPEDEIGGGGGGGSGGSGSKKPVPTVLRTNGVSIQLGQTLRRCVQKGWLYKRNSSTWRTSWKKRYFRVVLHTVVENVMIPGETPEDEPEIGIDEVVKASWLLYYDDDGPANEAKASISLEATIARATADTKIATKYPECFEVHHARRRTYYLRPCAPNTDQQQSRDHWMRVINASVQIIGDRFTSRFRR